MAIQTWSEEGGGFVRERVKSIPVTISATAVDVGNTTATYVLRQGLVLGIITATGEYAEFDNDNSDGTETAVAILMHVVDLKDGNPAGTAVDHVGDVLVNGTVNSDNLLWADAANDAAGGIIELEAAGITCLT